MRESTKHLLISVGLILAAALLVWALLFIFASISYSALFLALGASFVGGRYYGAAQGWWEIELRQDWKNTRSWNPKDLVGILLGFGLGMKPDEAEKEGWKAAGPKQAKH